MSELIHGPEMETRIVLAGIVLALVIGLIGTLVLFLSVKREARRLLLRERRRTDRQLQELRQSSGNAYCDQQAVRETRLHPGFTGRLPAMVGDPALPRTSEEFSEEMGLAQRAQALKRLRAGEPPDDVARQVGAPLCEIQLLARVEQHLGGLRESRNTEPTTIAPGKRADEPISHSTGRIPLENEDRSSTSGAPMEAPDRTTSPARQVRSAKAGGGKK